MKKIIILGAGITGLYLADELKDKYNILLIEKSFYLGGKIRTKYYDSYKNKIKYEAGPWRINTEHKRVLKLLKKYKINYSNIPSDLPETYKCFIDSSGKIRKNFYSKKDDSLKGSFSHTDNNIYTEGLEKSFKEDIGSGYQGNFDAHINTYPYSAKGNYLVINQGFQSIINKIIKSLNNSKVNILTNSLVKDVVKLDSKYEIILENGESFTSELLIITIPPENWCQWSIYNKLKPLSKCVESRSLHHIYAHSKKEFKINNHSDFYINTDSPLAQIISSSYRNNWFQISYSGGNVADFWFRLLLESKSKFTKKIKSELKKVLKYSKVSPANIDAIDKIESHYVRHGYHIWLPKYNFNFKKMLRQSIEPHPLELHNLYIAGESFSSNQGWVEGALETADKVINIIGQKSIKKIGNIKEIDFEYLLYDGRVLKVDKWKNRHPGSRKIIMSHIGENIEYFFNKIHSNETYGILANLHYCWIDHKGVLYQYR